MKPFLLSIIGILIITACSTNRTIYIRGYKASNKIEKSDSKDYVSNNKNRNTKSEDYRTFSTPNVSEQSDFETSLISSLDNSYSSISTSRNNKYYQNIKSDDKCDNLILKNGDEIKAKVIEITETSVKYKKCDNLNGPIYSISKSKIFMIQYTNGTKDVFKEDKQDTVQDNREKKSVSTSSEPTNMLSKDDTKRTTDKVSANSLTFALLGVLLFIVGGISNAPLFVIFSFIFLISAFILGIIGMHRVNKYPDKYKGKGAAIAGFVIGLLGIILFTSVLIIVAALI